MLQVFKIYSNTLDLFISEIKIFSIEGKNRLRADAKFFVETLSALDDIPGPSNNLQVVVNSLKIQTKKISSLVSMGLMGSSESILDQEIVISGQQKQNVVNDLSRVKINDRLSRISKEWKR